MKNRNLKSAVLALVALAACWTTARADVAFTYSVNGAGKAVVTKCSTSVKGAVAIPASLDGYEVTGLAASAFNGCKKITSVTVPATVTSIGNLCFRKCTALKSFTFADGRVDVLSIGDNVFEGAKLKTLVLPPKTLLSANAFFDSKITTLEVQDDTPTSFLYNLDDVLSPYTGSGSKLKLHSEIKKLIVPRGRKEIYEAVLDQFLYGRKKKNRGTVVAQYPRVWVDTTEKGTGASYFKVGDKKLANGAAVKPGTKNLQFVSVGASGYAPQNVSYQVDGVPVQTYNLNNTFKITMPSGDVVASGTFVTKAAEKAAIDKVVAWIIGQAQESASLNVPYTFNYQYSNQLKTKTTFTYAGLPKGLKNVFNGTLYTLTGTPTTPVDGEHAPIFVTIKGASGYSRTVAHQLSIGSAAGLPYLCETLPKQTYDKTAHTLGVLAGVNYASSQNPVSFNVTSGWKISSNSKTLPTGIKLVKTSKTTAVLAGRPTKPGTYIVEVVLSKGKTKKTARIAYQVYAHPLKGSYRGYVNTPGVGGGAMTMTVDAAGKATVAFTEKSTKTTIKNVYPALRDGIWNASSPLVGEFTYTFKVPKDKKRKLPARTLRLAYATDASSGVADVAHVRGGPIAAFSLVSDDGSGTGDADRVRCYPQFTGATAMAHPFYSSIYRRGHACFSILPNASVSDYTTGEAIWTTVVYDWAKATVAVRGRLPAGKAFSTTLPLVSAYWMYQSGAQWNKYSENSYNAIAVAPLFITDVDGRQYMLTLPTDPTELGVYRGGYETTGFYACSGTLGTLSWIPGSTAYNREPVKASPLAALNNATPTLRMEFDEGYWNTATGLGASINTGLNTISLNGVDYNTYTFDTKTGLWTFSFLYGGVTYTFEGVPCASKGFYGIIRSTVNNKTFTWGAARIQ